MEEAIDLTGNNNSVVYYYEHPLGDLIRYLILNKDGFADGQEDDRATLCPCRRCKPPSWFARFVERYLLRQESLERANKLASSTVCINGKHLLEWGKTQQQQQQQSNINNNNNNNNEKKQCQMVEIAAVVMSAESIWQSNNKKEDSGRGS